ncbi:uncharacterized protein MKZ38_003202 [Zalerion maritima]|uniref:Embryonic ectoderm development protein n=1 Tax=Zalerion maritima TaxID=339359 RepID=A0AAD5RYZ2_9PEZI|nr:uncharacterized protein MKZ38_003202 [Zalerion maritima]
MNSQKKDEWELPKLYSSFGFQDDSRFLPSDPDNRNIDSEFMGVQFYPYLAPSENPIFAACSPKHVLICRISPKTRPANAHPVEILDEIRDGEELSNNWTVTWAMAEDATPLLCISGQDAKIKVYDVVKKSCTETLVGHGDDVNDLKTSPSDPLIIASASRDTTVRVWSLKLQHKAQPCMYILGGDAHQYDLLTLAFHQNGRYILSSGHDQIINLWTLTGELPSESKSTTQPTQIFYPHFSTSEVHSALIDCVAFFGDLVLSRACYEQKIVLWSIDGFDSTETLPSREDAPSNYDQNIPTRSAFSTGSKRFSRHLELQTKGVGQAGEMFYMRFGIYAYPGKYPILAFGNAKSKVFFWDFQRLRAFHIFMRDVKRGQRPRALDWFPAVKPKGRNPSSRFGSRETGTSDSSDRQSTYKDGALATWNDKYGMTNPTKLLAPHHTALLPTKDDFVARQASWSPSGEWCVVVGSGSQCAILRRRKEG